MTKGTALGTSAGHIVTPETRIDARSFCSLISSGLADIPAQMRAMYEFRKDKGLSGGWRYIGDVIGVSGAYARELAHGDKPLSRHHVVLWLSAIGEIPITTEAEVCPSCLRTKGELVIHDAGDCHGRPISAVVTLAPDEAVVKRNGHAPTKTQRKARKSISLDPAVWEASNVRRIAAGMTWDEWEKR